MKSVTSALVALKHSLLRVVEDMSVGTAAGGGEELSEEIQVTLSQPTLGR